MLDNSANPLFQQERKGSLICFDNKELPQKQSFKFRSVSIEMARIFWIKTVTHTA